MSATSDFEIKLKDGDGNVFRTITGIKTLPAIANPANTGVCQTFDGSTPVGDHAFYPSDLQPGAGGYFYVLNTQVLNY